MDPETLTLTEFLLARIVEDEAWVLGDGGQHMDDCHECGFANQQTSSPYRRSRILAETVVKRQILEELSDRFPRRRADPVFTGHLLRVLALPYTHHPDYRDDWRPQRGVNVTPAAPSKQRNTRERTPGEGSMTARCLARAAR